MRYGAHVGIVVGNFRFHWIRGARIARCSRRQHICLRSDRCRKSGRNCGCLRIGPPSALPCRCGPGGPNRLLPAAATAMHLRQAQAVAALGSFELDLATGAFHGSNHKRNSFGCRNPNSPKNARGINSGATKNGRHGLFGKPDRGLAKTSSSTASRCTARWPPAPI